MMMHHATRNRRLGSAGDARAGVVGRPRLLLRNQSDSAVHDRRNTGNWMSSSSQDSSKKKPPFKSRKTLSEPGNKTVQVSAESCSDVCGEQSDDDDDDDDGVDIEVDVEGHGIVEVHAKVVEEEEEEDKKKKKIDEIHAMPGPLIVEECREDDGFEEEEEERICETEDNRNKRMQNIVDLVMWRDVSRSAFVFGIGSFLLISSSYTKDSNFSLISTISYMGLFYLGTIFLYTSIARCDVDCRKKKWVITEEDATQLIYKLLPYINGILTNTNTLFSGDPATTIKTAMALFLLARCGGIVPISTMFKLAFFGVFTVPRLVSAYSIHIERYGTFLLDRSRDAWDTCTHKKAAAATTFAVVWNLSSPSARTWIVFMVVVAVRYYQKQQQQQMTMTAAKECDHDEDDGGKEGK